MSKSDKVHFAHVDRGNESDPWDHWYDPICGTYADDPAVSDKTEDVTCKNCLSRIKKSEEKGGKNG